MLRHIETDAADPLRRPLAGRPLLKLMPALQVAHRGHDPVPSTGKRQNCEQAKSAGRPRNESDRQAAAYQDGTVTPLS
ncbi:hypothetical protein PbDSM24746_35880 [Paenibacillus macerans]|nr:hypothetical protein PbDSM24746_35880 [Paenibacillus macerans]GBK69897.1 hypothetical protein PbJCM17693_36050 [Paenibacillus macerans]